MQVTGPRNAPLFSDSSRSLWARRGRSWFGGPVQRLAGEMAQRPRPVHGKPYGTAMDVELLTVPECPNRTIALSRLHEALDRAGIEGVTLVERIIDDPAAAAAAGMHGSPTILIEGRDLFESDSANGSVSCRLYRTAEGTSGAPTVEELVDALGGRR